ncbi:SGNH/GDSL hydrolase family protein [Pseudonocardiaceae bacterium YIM PH 21723]|nr:SGNH/GDSL hydrolase family protein [Pseudonocardiaceae bacterium YIM PH 21723]
MSRVTVLLAVLLTSALTAPAAHASAGNYVAIGDSYASGLGIGGETGSCDRSDRAYPVQWSQSPKHTIPLTNATCSGATTTDALNKQVSQVTGASTVVSVQIGGNDGDFSGVMTTCQLQTYANCSAAADRADAAFTGPMRQNLARIYAEIRNRAPNARIVALGYPRLFDTAPAGSCSGITADKQRRLNQSAEVLDASIRGSSEQAGVPYVSAIPYFAAHGVCAGERWLNPLNVFNKRQSYHPNLGGHSYGFVPMLDSVT